MPFRAQILIYLEIKHFATQVYGSLKNCQKSYLGTTQASQNCILEEIEGRLNSGNACSHSFQSFVLVRHPETYRVKIYKDGCETCLLALEHGSENI
jgi:hypothetical protein